MSVRYGEKFELTDGGAPGRIQQSGRSRRAQKYSQWTPGNELQLLQNGEEFYPALLESIDSANELVVIETFIWFEDSVGFQVSAALRRAARRGVEVRVLVDGYGSPRFSEDFLAELSEAGVTVNQFDPQPTLLGIRTNILCRMHRKITVVDRSDAFIGGINISEDHLGESGAASKEDFAVRIRGPAVEHIRHYVLRSYDDERGRWWRRWRYWIRRFPKELADPNGGEGQVLFAIRDNDQHPTDIETLYRLAIRKAREEIIIACAYFFPGYRFVRDLRKAVQRGVSVKLIMQGNPDRPIEVGLASVLFDDLVPAGVKVYRYTRRALHAKVAIVDERWATVGSSNLDPTSLGLNYEANIFALDRAFNRDLKGRLLRLIDESCEEFSIDSAPVSWLRRAVAALIYHLTRRVPTWGARMLRRKQSVTRI